LDFFIGQHRTPTTTIFFLLLSQQSHISPNKNNIPPTTSTRWAIFWLISLRSNWMLLYILA
jgi:hypothetical protein